ncbi:NUDIX hydrolase [Desertivirga xinjiangensis]|uniref:NUDIX hydrolase n=1 Tax=Desertivirga xinjiangensis TaxID=539206 RepID=UPI00210C44D7|nr:NUDIX domain-containing protein [Pedobacter xinjiangensis]
MQTGLPKFHSIFSVDCVVFGFEDGVLKILLVERNEEPFNGWWALPGFFVQHDEGIDYAAERILYELTGLRDIYMEQLYTFGDVNRHPEGRVITVAYYAMIRLSGKNELHPTSNIVKKAFWHPIADLPKLGFDHTEIFEKSLDKIKRKISYQPIAFELLPEKFTLTQLQNVYEAILNKKLDKRNFRKKMLNYGILKELDEKQRGVSFRAAALYKFDRRKYAKLFQKELSFMKD